MRIALLAHCRHPIAEPYQGGLEAHTALLADALVARGHDVIMLAKQGSRSRAAVLPLIPAHVHPGLHREHDQIHDRALRSAVPELDVDVIINNSLSAVPYLHLADRPVLTVLHTPADLARVADVVAHPAWRPSSRHVWAGVSGLTTRSWRPYLPQVHCVPNGIDLARWAPRPGVRRRRRRAVWTGRITPEKGLAVAVQAAKIAGFSLQISGPVADPDYFDRAVRPHLDHRVRYVGHLDHARLPAFLQSAAVYVFSPLWPEPFGLALVEALAGGTPAAALPSGAVPEIITPAGGVIAAEPSSEALAAAMIAAARLDREAAAASVVGFDQTTMIDAYERLLAELITRNPAQVAASRGGTPCR